jgi:iron complex outermembrane receptor protein
VGGSQWQLFGNLRWQPAAKWTVNLGGMLEKHYFTERLFSPRWAVNYALEPSHVLRVSGGRGYRAPTAFEERSREEYRYNGTVADVGYWSYQHLRPEQVDFTEAGYVGHFRDIGLRVDARLFWEEYTHYIDDQSCQLGGGAPACVFPAPPGYAHIYGSTKAFYFLNSGDINVRGNEIQLDWRNAAVGRVVLGHTYNRITAGANVDQDVPSSAPLNTTSLLWMRSFPDGFSASMGYYFVGPMKWLNDGDYQAPYRRVDARLAKEFGKRGAGNELSLTLQNLGGAYHEFTPGDFVAERRSFVTLRLGL